MVYNYSIISFTDVSVRVFSSVLMLDLAGGDTFILKSKAQLSPRVSDIGLWTCILKLL